MIDSLRQALKVAKKYMDEDPSGRKAGETVLLIIRHGACAP